jgi:hypothetical protein
MSPVWFLLKINSTFLSLLACDPACHALVSDVITMIGAAIASPVATLPLFVRQLFPLFRMKPQRLLWMTLLPLFAESGLSWRHAIDDGFIASWETKGSCGWSSSSSIARFSRGGSSQHTKKKSKKRRKVSREAPPSNHDESESEDPFVTLAKALRRELEQVDHDGEPSTSDGRTVSVSVDRIVDAFRLLSSAQQAFKGLDGAAHEAYQRTHSSASSSLSADADPTGDIASVTGRASRSAARASAVADGLGACELCELIELPHLRSSDDDSNSTTTTLSGRHVLVNETSAISLGTIRSSSSDEERELKLSLLVLYEPDYQGGAGVEHGGIVQDDEDGSSPTPSVRRSKGRLIVILSDTARRSLGETVAALAQTPPAHVRLKGQGSEAGSVQPNLYRAAASVLLLAEEPLRQYNESAVHFVGRSLAGGVASLAGSILHGSIPMPPKSGTKGTKIRKNRLADDVAVPPKNESSAPTSPVNGTADASEEAPPPPPLQGLGAGRTSVLTLGAPPCMSPNIPADYITSIVYGDDVVCRASHSALLRLVDRTRRNLGTKGGSIGRSIHWVSDALSLAASNLKSHAHGSEGEEARLAVPGRAFLVRPRRLGDACSIHEIGSQLKGGREALRAAMLWQLNDVLLSRSMWRHHQLESYIHGLDRVQLRAVDQDSA